MKIEDVPDDWMLEAVKVMRAGSSIYDNTRAAIAAVAPLIAAAEREACAAIADGTSGDPEWHGETWIAQRIAAAIRARSDAP